MHQPLIRFPDIPEIDIVAIGHKAKRPKTLLLLDFLDVEFSLGLGQGRVDASALRFDDGVIWPLGCLST